MSGKTRAETLIVQANQRVGADQVEVISNQHQIPRRKATIDPARGVAHDQRTRPEALHEGRREGDAVHVVAFVVVEAPCMATAMNACRSVRTPSARREDVE